jgi:hypothetical protein
VLCVLSNKNKVKVRSSDVTHCPWDFLGGCMRTTPHVALLLLVCLVPVSAIAQTAAPNPQPKTTSEPQAVSILQQSLSALTGGATATDATLTGTASLTVGPDSETGTATLKVTALGDSRLDLSFPSGNRSEIRNHAGTPPVLSLPVGAPTPVGSTNTLQPIGYWSGPDGAFHNMAGHNVLTDSTWFFPAFTVFRLASQNYVLSYGGAETFNGQSVLHISATLGVPNASAETLTELQRLSRLDLYVDPTTFLPVALVFNAHADTNAAVDIATEIRFSNYRPVSGMAIPFHVQRYSMAVWCLIFS